MNSGKTQIANANAHLVAAHIQFDEVMADCECVNATDVVIAENTDPKVCA